LRLSRFAFFAMHHLLFMTRCLHQRSQRNAIDKVGLLSTSKRNLDRWGLN
jgi:hypothetical protein